MSKRTKIKKYTAMSVWLPVKKELAAANGGLQFSICVKTTTKKRIAELLTFYGSRPTMNRLNNFYGLMENDTYSFEPPENDVIYFHNEHMGTPHYGEWLKLDDWR